MSKSEELENAERMARMERALSDERRKQYEALLRQNEIEKKRAEKVLDERFKAYRTQQQKFVLPSKPQDFLDDDMDMRKYRHVARELVIQQDAVVLLAREHERERCEFLTQATAEMSFGHSPHAPPPSRNERAAQMRERLEQARQTPTSPSRREPSQD